jgi:hypothetical protein
MSSYKNPSLFCYPLECSQNELSRLDRLKRQREEFELNEKETVEETILLRRMKTVLPDSLIKEIGEFSGVVIRQRFLVKVEYFDRWIIDNVGRVTSLLDTWSKPHVAFVLTRIIQLEKPECTSYLKGVGNLYNRFTKTEMAKALRFISVIVRESRDKTFFLTTRSAFFPTILPRVR